MANPDDVIPRPTSRTHRLRVLLVAALLAALAPIILGACSNGSDPQNSTFSGLVAGQRVYDTTNGSLDDVQKAALQTRLDDLQRDTGADVVVYVRDLDADSDATLNQVEALYNAWVSATGASADTAGAILINREPGTGDEARAGVFVGRTYDEGNVPRDEQEAIVDDALIPPLRDGKVADSLTAGIDRLRSSILLGPPTTALNHLAAGPGSTWLPWTGLGLALLGFFAVARVYRTRARPTVEAGKPTTIRPDLTETAIATALIHGSAQASGLPGTVLALVAASAVRLEPQKSGDKRTKEAVGIRLLDSTRVRGDVARAVWNLLERHAVDGLVDSTALKKVVGKSAELAPVIDAEFRSKGRLNEGARRRRWTLVLLVLAALVLAIAGTVVASGGSVLMLLTVIPAAVLVITGIVAAAKYSRLTAAGLDAARPWQAYRDGLRDAADAEGPAGVDLDAALPDIVSFGLVPKFKSHLDTATESGSGLRAFTSAGGNPVAWAAFSTVFVPTMGGGGTVSGGGVAGGGGAAGST